MKQVITLDAIIVSLLGSMGYGFGYQIPSAYGLSPLICLVVCMVFGTVVEMSADKILFSSYVQKSNKRRYTAFAAAVLLFLLGVWYLAHRFSYLLWKDTGTELVFAVMLPVVAFAVSLVVNVIKRKKLLKKYGTGESGFIVDEESERLLLPFMGENKEIERNIGDAPAVKTYGGTFIGKTNKNVTYFLGIPYAKAPVGGNRWKKPVPVDASDKIFEAYYFGASEIQPNSTHNILAKAKQDEDCLNLNIWTTKLEPNASKPVFVYIHGGDGRYGGSAHPLYHLDTLARNIPDAVFVSINYRFGVFGVLDFSAIGSPDADEYADSTALSLLDQIEALKWIKSNISAFGGDPENITVAGNDAGGSCICLLSTLKEAKGLFKRALIFCASTTDTPTDDGKASLVGKKLWEEFGAKNISDLKTVSAEELRDFSERNYDLMELPPRDGRFVPQDMEKMYLSGAASDIEFIFGIAADNASGWQAMVTGDLSIEEMVNSYYEVFLDAIGIEKVGKAEELLQSYLSSGISVTDAKRALLSDSFYKTAVLHDCRTLIRGGSKVRCFYWDVKGDIEKMTANSASMVTAILGNSEIAEQMGYLHDKGLTEIMQVLVGRFMRGQKPELFNNELKGVSEIVWDEFDTSKNYVLHIQKDSIHMTESALSENVCELEKLMFAE